VPFTAEELLDTFARYNAALWPMTAVLSALAMMAAALATTSEPVFHRAIAVVLGLLWAWTAIAFHIAYFADINPAALPFGALFLAQAFLLARAGLRGPGLEFQLAGDLRGALAVALVGYALFGYPIVSRALGHLYPATPTFGLPCPTTMFTVGMLLTARRCPPHLVMIPAAWSLIGWSAAWRLGMAEDHGLLVSAVAALGLGAHELSRQLAHGPTRARRST
jgi:hypothetical protein